MVIFILIYAIPLFEGKNIEIIITGSQDCQNKTYQNNIENRLFMDFI
jgi:hypothetical protein